MTYTMDTSILALRKNAIDGMINLGFEIDLKGQSTVAGSSAYFEAFAIHDKRWVLFDVRISDHMVGHGRMNKHFLIFDNEDVKRLLEIAKEKIDELHAMDTNDDEDE